MKNTQLLSIITVLFLSFEGIGQNIACRIDTVYYYENVTGTNFINLKSRHIYDYDNLDREIKVVQQFFNEGDNSYTNYFAENHTYNQLGQLTEKSRHYWNITNNTWVGDQKWMHTYNANETQHVTLFFIWSQSDNFWYPIERTEQNVVSSQYGYTIRQQMGQNGWVNSIRHESQRNELGQTIETLEQNWDVNLETWVNSIQTTYSYNSAALNTLRTSQIWNSNIWVNNQRNTYTYNDQGEMILHVSENWNNGLNDWVNFRRTVVNFTDNLMISTHQAWDNLLSFWLNDFRTTITFDTQGNQLERFRETWVASINNFQNNFLYLYEYNENNFMTKSHGWSSWNPTFQFYESQSISEIVCSNMEVVQIIENDELNFKIYPNPIQQNEMLTISTESMQNYTIIDVLGKVKAEGVLQSGNNEIEITDLHSGIYFIKLKQTTFKLIVE